MIKKMRIVVALFFSFVCLNSYAALSVAPNGFLATADGQLWFVPFSGDPATEVISPLTPSYALSVITDGRSYFAIADQYNLPHFFSSQNGRQWRSVNVSISGKYAKPNKFWQTTAVLGHDLSHLLSANGAMYSESYWLNNMVICSSRDGGANWACNTKLPSLVGTPVSTCGSDFVVATTTIIPTPSGGVEYEKIQYVDPDGSVKVASRLPSGRYMCVGSNVWLGTTKGIYEVKNGNAKLASNLRLDGFAAIVIAGSTVYVYNEKLNSSGQGYSVLVSRDDGKHFVSETTNLTDMLNSVAFSHGMFLAQIGGALGNTRLISSRNGVHWHTVQ